MRSDISILDTRSGEITPLVASVGSESDPTWSPDGRFIAYQATQPETNEPGIRVIARETSTDITQRSWQAPFKADWLIAEDDSQYQAMLDDFEDGSGNIRSSGVEGEVAIPDKS